MNFWVFRDKPQTVVIRPKGKKNGKPNIAPLQPPTLATFRPWGSSAGAGRARFAGAKIRKVWSKSTRLC